jgi:cation diffusion facilitator CzcD-associated flavoprotein CzcO
MKGVPKRVCVIGAGANGLATLKVLAEMHQVQSGQWSLVAFEARDNVGGIWYRSQ